MEVQCFSRTTRISISAPRSRIVTHELEHGGVIRATGTGGLWHMHVALVHPSWNWKHPPWIICAGSAGSDQLGRDRFRASASMTTHREEVQRAHNAWRDFLTDAATKIGIVLPGLADPRRHRNTENILLFRLTDAFPTFRATSARHAQQAKLCHSK